MAVRHEVIRRDPDLILIDSARKVYQRVDGVFSNVDFYHEIRDIKADDELVLIICAGKIFVSFDGLQTHHDFSGDTDWTNAIVGAICRTRSYNCIIVATDRAVLATRISYNYTPTWKLISKLSDITISDMHYNNVDDVVIIGTVGSGIWQMLDLSKHLYNIFAD